MNQVDLGKKKNIFFNSYSRQFLTDVLCECNFFALYAKNNFRITIRIRNNLRQITRYCLQIKRHKNVFKNQILFMLFIKTLKRYERKKLLKRNW